MAVAVIHLALAGEGSAAQIDPYTSPRGLSGGAVTGGGGPNPSPRRAGMELNPAGRGQVLFGSYYDVRNVPSAIGGSSSQDTFIRILNTNPPSAAGRGGVLFRIVFRESGKGREVLSFDVVLACAQVWTAQLSLDPGSGNARIVSPDPIRIQTTTTTFVTDDVLTNGIPFAQVAGTTPDDRSRGYFEIIAEELLPCAPNEVGGLSPGGNTFTRLPEAEATPPNRLSGEVLLVQPGSGRVYGYQMPAISRFVADGAGPITAPVGSGAPNLTSCRIPDNSSPTAIATGATCLDDLEMALAKSRLAVSFDNESETAAETRLVATLPTRNARCGTGTTQVEPFGCTARGEKMACKIYDRSQHLLPPSSSGKKPKCFLKRATNVLSIARTPILSPADGIIRTQNDVASFAAGWVDLNLANDAAHVKSGLDSDVVDVLGVGMTGFRGLPILPLVLQDYFFGTVGAVPGIATEPPYEVQYDDGAGG